MSSRHRSVVAHSHTLVLIINRGFDSPLPAAAVDCARRDPPHGGREVVTLDEGNWLPTPSPFDLHRYSFVQQIVHYAPSDAGGIYVLWENKEIIYIGRTRGGQTIRECLVEHCDGAKGACTLTTTHYSWEVTSEPAARQAELLDQFSRVYLKKPRCQSQTR